MILVRTVSSLKNSSWNIPNESLNCPLSTQIAKTSKSHLCKNPCTQMCKHLFWGTFFGPPGSKNFFQLKQKKNQLACFVCFLSSLKVPALWTLWKEIWSHNVTLQKVGMLTIPMFMNSHYKKHFFLFIPPIEEGILVRMQAISSNSVINFGNETIFSAYTILKSVTTRDFSPRKHSTP